MPKQHITVPLLEEVHSSIEALTLKGTTMIGGIKCEVLLPSPDPAWNSLEGGKLKPPYDEHLTDASPGPAG